MGGATTVDAVFQPNPQSDPYYVLCPNCYAEMFEGLRPRVDVTITESRKLPAPLMTTFEPLASPDTPEVRIGADGTWMYSKNGNVVNINDTEMAQDSLL